MKLSKLRKYLEIFEEIENDAEVSLCNTSIVIDNKPLLIYLNLREEKEEK